MHARPTPVIILLESPLRRAAEKEGLTTPAALADRLGVQRSSVTRIFNGDRRIGEKTIAAVLAAFPGSRFEDFFRVAYEAPPSTETTAA